jgi:hypothetical protein
MAGAGYKLFATGDVLTAAQVNTYLMQQTVMVFASSAARTAALSGVLAEGMVSYLSDTNALQYYDGAAWQDVANPGDITAVTVTSPITGGGTSGSVGIAIQDALTTQKGAVQLSDSTSTTSSILAATPTAVKSAYDLANTANTTATAAIPKSTVTTAGDVIYATGSSALTRLGIGTAGQVLTVNGGATAPSWATPAGGGKILQVVSATTTTSTTINSATFTDTTLSASITPSNVSSRILVITTQGWATTRTDSGMEVAFRLLRGSTVVYAPHETTNVMTWGISYTGVTSISAWNGVMNMSYVDSPASTSAQTYKTQGMNRTTSNSATFVVQRNSFPASIILMEIGA